jgi:hypothetical protein
VNARAAVATLYVWQCRVKVYGEYRWGGNWEWIRHCELCCAGDDDFPGWKNTAKRGWRHFAVAGDYELEFDTWEAAMLSARDHLAAHRRALPAQIGES